MRVSEPRLWSAPTGERRWSRRGEARNRSNLVLADLFAAGRQPALSAGLLIAGLLMAGAGPAAAQGNFIGEQWPDDDRPPPVMTLEELGDRVEAGREMVGRQIDEAARFVDSFFDDERLEGEYADARLRLGASYFIEPGDVSGLQADVNLSVSLPQTEERLRLVVTGAFWRDDEEDEDELRRRARPGSPEEDETSSFAADLRYVILEDLEQNLDARVGLRVRGFVPAGVTGLRYRRSWEPEPWRVRLTNRVEWETLRGFSADSFVDFDARPAEDFFFRASPAIRWREDRSGFAYGFGFALTQRLGERRFLQYSLDYDFSSSPDHGLDQILLRARYRQTLFRTWVFGEIAPQIRLADRDGADGTPGITFRVQAVF